MNNKDKIACVTGASGTVGRKIVERLLIEGYTVRVLSRKGYFDDPRAHLFNGGLEDEEILRSFLLNADLLFHCAAEINDEGKMWDVNVHGTERLLRIVKDSTIKYLCYLSSAGVVGRTNKKWVNEETECNPQTLYEQSKFAAEQLVARGLDGCRIVIIRPTNIVDESRPDTHFIISDSSWFCRLIVFLKGAEFAHIVHAKDVADAALYFITHPTDTIQRFFVSCDHEPLNTFAGIWALSKAARNNRPVKLPLHLPKIVPNKFRKLWGGKQHSHQTQSRYSSEKILSEGFRFHLGLEGAVRQVVSSGVSFSLIESDEYNPTFAIYRKLISGSTWAFVGKVITGLAGLTINALLARLLTVEAMGAYFLTLSLCMISAVVAQLGFNLTVVRLIAESIGFGSPARAAKSIILSFRYVAIGVFIVVVTLISGAGVWIAERLFDSTLITGVITLASFWVAVLAFQHLSGEIFRGFNDIRLATVFGGMLTSIFSVLMFAGLWILQGNSDLEQVIKLSIMAGATSTLIAFLFIRDKCHKIKGDNDLKDKEVLRITLPLWLTNMMLFVLIQADLWILGIFQDQESVAVYGAASRLLAFVSLPLLIVEAVVPPLIAEMHTKGKKQNLEHSLRVTATLAGIPAFCILVFLSLFPGFVLELVYGNYYRNGAIVLIILSLGQFVKVASGSCGLALMMTGHEVRMMSITGFCGLLTIIASVILVRDYGLFGVAAATSSGMILQNLLMLFSVKQKVDFWTHIKIPFNVFSKKLT